MANVNDTKEIPSLTGVRFVLVTMVFLIHYSHRLLFLGNFPVGIINQFYLSLHMFYVLSGFVICYKYYDQSQAGKSALLTYYLKRFSKIYPVFFLLTTFTYVVWAIKGETNVSLLKEWLLNISFIKGFSVKYYLSGIGPSWSLCVEEFFYLFSPLIFLLIKKKKIFFSQVLCWWAIGAILLFFFTQFPFEGFFGDAFFVYFATFFGRCFEFYCGIFLALLIMGRLNFIKVKLPFFSFPFYTLTGIIWMGLGILSLYFNQYYNEESLVIKVLLSNLFFPVGVALFYLGLIRETSFLQKLFSKSLFQLLGKSSYAFFLLHTGVIATVFERYLRYNVILLFIVLQVASVFLFLFFERPVSKLIRSKRRNWVNNRRSTMEPG
jgi:peptidoglycan/LPS O-acetylase OafA/YrhL